jgi:hypothetical protein
MSKMITCLVMAAMLTGCVTGVPIPVHTVLLGEVVALSSSDHPDGGVEHAGKFEEFPDDLAAECAVNGSVAEEQQLALVRHFYYWHNGSRLREAVRWYPMSDGIDLSTGNLVEVEMLVGSTGPDSRCLRVTRKRAGTLGGGGCRYARADRAGMLQAYDAINPIGGSGSASIDSSRLEAAGWQKRGFGPYGATVLTRAPPELP